MTVELGMLIILLIFGAAYNWLVARIERAVPDHGYTAIWVIGGVLITVLATVPVIGWDSAIYVLLAFAASGLLMTLGSIQRHLTRRQADLDRQRAELSNGH
jgi:hypothetical protein